MEFDWDVSVTIKVKGKTTEEFEAFITELKTKLSQLRANEIIFGSKVIINQKYKDREWHDGIE